MEYVTLPSEEHRRHRGREKVGSSVVGGQLSGERNLKVGSKTWTLHEDRYLPLGHRPIAIWSSIQPLLG